MKKIIFLNIFLVFILCQTLPVEATSPKYSANPMNAVVGSWDIGAAASFTIDSNYINYVSGDVFATLHLARESQTSGAFKIYAYCTGASGSPTAVSLFLESARGSEDGDRPRPGSSATSTSDTIDMSGCGTAQWKTFTFTDVTTVMGQHYWGLITNNAGTPASNSFNIASRGALDAATIIANAETQHGAYTATNGFSADGTAITTFSPMIFCYASGNCYGNPYVASATHAANQNYRGVRLTPTEDLQVKTWGTAVADTSLTSMTVANGSSLVMLDENIDTVQSARGPITSTTTTTLSGGSAYDFVIKSSVNDTLGFVVYHMGSAPPPSDVILTSSALIYVDGATLGSLIASTTATGPVFIEIADNPEITTGGGMTIYEDSPVSLP